VIAGASIFVVAMTGGGVAIAEPGGDTMRVGADEVGQPGDVAPMIIGGDDATEKYKFHVSVLNYAPSAGKVVSYCGGTLVSPRVVLTAAHCLADFTVGETQVRVGSNLWTSGGHVRDIVAMKTYPAWSWQPGSDLGLLLLSDAVPEKPIKIGRDTGPVGQEYRLIGYGTNCDIPLGGPCYPEGLMEAPQTRAPDSRCDWFDASVEVCTTGPNGEAACYADSGSSLLRTAGGGWEQIGTVSRDGDADADNMMCGGGATVYTDVTKYRQWIKSETRAWGSEAA
jgi:secreted trypsin-like serine protease